MAVPGVAGVRTHGSTGTWKPNAAIEGEIRFATVVYLDARLRVAKSITSSVKRRRQSGAVRPLVVAR